MRVGRVAEDHPGLVLERQAGKADPDGGKNE
jgi:hypothetical protein